MVLGASTWAKNPALPFGDHFDGFIASQIQTGRYGSASEVIRSALRLLETQETKLNTLRQLLVAGEESGEAEYDLENLISKQP